MHSSIKEALEAHNALIVVYIRKSRVEDNLMLEDTLVTKALLRRRHSNTISDDDDEVNDNPAEVANKDLIRRR